MLKEAKMKKLVLPVLLLSFSLLLAIGCGGPPPPPPEEPVIEEPVTPPVEETKPEPEPEPEPEVIKISEADFKIVYFDFDKYNLTDAAKTALEQNAKILKENAAASLVIHDQDTFDYHT